MAMKTAIVDTRADIAKSVATAVAVLKSKNLVAIPTETVYGLAGDALEPDALAKIFEAKERPYFDPRLAERILDSFRIVFFHEEPDQ